MRYNRIYIYHCAKVFCDDGIHVKFVEPCHTPEVAKERAELWRERGYKARAELVEYDNNKGGLHYTVLD